MFLRETRKRSAKFVLILNLLVLESKMSSAQERLLAAVPLVAEAVRQLQLLLQQDEEDEEMALAVISHMRSPNQQRSQVFVEAILPLFSAEQFRENFRLLPETFEFVLGEIAIHIEPILYRDNVCSPEKQLLIALWRFATPDSYRSIVLRFGVAKATGIKAVDQVSNALVKIAHKYITWPTGERAIEVAQGFNLAHGYPDIIGAIDGTHINILAPTENPEAYINRKSKHSIQCQLVCDHQRLITNAYVGQVGSVHDARVFRLSPIFDFVQDPTKFSENTHIIGDSAYALGRHVMVPYTDNGHLTQRQKNFNYCHSSTRMVIERTNGLLKGRWRSLLDCLAMRRIHMVPYHVMACCVLHNICLLKNDEIRYEEISEEDYDEQARNPQNNNWNDRRAGEIKRRYITDILPMRLPSDA